ncbi:MAG: AbrB/MazE/SpoVT family DNA-binding domain-containing protein [Candidatus Manganitrophaceae bacterium]
MIPTTLTKKGQVTIPKEIRDFLGLKEHDKVLFIEREGTVILKPLKGNILDLKGSVPPKNRPEDFSSVRERVKKKMAERQAGRDGQGIR